MAWPASSRKGPLYQVGLHRVHAGRACGWRSSFHSAAIRSSKRLTYEQVDAFLADPEAWRRKLGVKVHALLGRMHPLAMILRKRRLSAARWN